jgi:hypothetical protein
MSKISILFFMLLVFLPGFAHAQISAQICGTTVIPKTSLQPFVDAGVTTRVWRDKVTACGADLQVMFWNQPVQNHWIMTVQRVVINPLASRLPSIAVTAELREAGQRVAVINGPLSEFQLGYAENKPLSPRTTPDQLRKSHLVPPFALLSGGASASRFGGAMTSSGGHAFVSLKDGPLTRYMPTTGERADIGLVHESCVNWLSSAASFAWTACLDAAKDQSNIPWHIFEQGKPNLFMSPALKQAGFDERNEFGKVLRLPETDMKWRPDHAHQPNALLVPYMATRHPYFLYLAQFQFGVQLGGLDCPPDYGKRFASPLPTILSDQRRGVAWSFRTLTQTVLMTPAKTPPWLHSKASLTTLLRASIDRWSTEVAGERGYWQQLQAGTATAKVPDAYSVALNYSRPSTPLITAKTQMWEMDYLGIAVGFARWAGVTEVEPLYGYYRDILLARYTAGSPYRALGAPFSIAMNDPQTGTPARNLADVVKFSPGENHDKGINGDLIVGTANSIGMWTTISWHIQGNLALCSLNGDKRCDEPLAWWNGQAARFGDRNFDKYRMSERLGQ